jgi:hypothetical protein
MKTGSEERSTERAPSPPFSESFRARRIWRANEGPALCEQPAPLAVIRCEAVPLSMLACLTQLGRCSCALLAALGAVGGYGGRDVPRNLSDRGRRRTFDPVRGPGDGRLRRHVGHAGVV